VGGLSARAFSVALANADRYDDLMDDLSQQWAERAQYDLDTADAMFKAGRYLYVLFCCQQAVEKALKAVIVRKTGELPPRIHNLLRLAEVAGMKSSPEQGRFLGELSGYYIQTRYPEEIRATGAAITKELAQGTLGRTEQMVKWVLSMLQ
jgi:HEPN domain-containing protein